MCVLQLANFLRRSPAPLLTASYTYFHDCQISQFVWISMQISSLIESGFQSLKGRPLIAPTSWTATYLYPQIKERCERMAARGSLVKYDTFGNLTRCKAPDWLPPYLSFSSAAIIIAISHSTWFINHWILRMARRRGKSTTLGFYNINKTIMNCKIGEYGHPLPHGLMGDRRNGL